MRKQYHFRPSRHGYYAWDVDRLIMLSKDLPCTKFPLDAIREVDENYWFADRNDTPTCRALVDHMKLVAEASLRYPIILSSDGRVMDGMHRVAKALLEERECIDTFQFSKDPEPDYEDVHPDDLPY